MALTDDLTLAALPADQAGYPVKAGVLIYRGACVGEDGSGYARPLVAGDPFLGFNDQGNRIDNSNGADGDLLVSLKTDGARVLEVIGATSGVANDRPAVYASDDGTFTLTATGNTLIGYVLSWVSGISCVVEFGAALARAAAAGGGGGGASAASDVTIADAGGFLDATSVEQAIAELAGIAPGLVSYGPVSLSRDFGVIGDNSTDETAKLQAAIDEIEADTKRSVILHDAGTIRLTAPITIDQPLAIIGEANSTQRGNAAPTVTQGGVFWIDHTGKGFVCNTPDNRQSTSFRRITTRRNQPSYTGDPWTPTSNDFDFYGELGDLELYDCFIQNATKGIYKDTDRLKVRGLEAHVFDIGIEIKASADVCRLFDVHFWPWWWSSNEAIFTYQRNNLSVLKLWRADGIILDNIFAYSCKEFLLFMQDGAENAVKKMMGTNLGADQTRAFIKVDNSVTNGVTAQLSGCYHYGPLVAPEEGVGIDIDGNNSHFDFVNLELYRGGDSLIDVAGAGNVVTFSGQLDVNTWDLNDNGAPGIRVSDGNDVAVNAYVTKTAVSQALLFGETGNIFLPPRANAGDTMVTTASGDLVVPHDLGRLPTSASLEIHNNPTAIALLTGVTATAAHFRVYNFLTQAELPNTTLTVSLKVGSGFGGTRDEIAFNSLVYGTALPALMGGTPQGIAPDGHVAAIAASLTVNSALASCATKSDFANSAMIPIRNNLNRLQTRWNDMRAALASAGDGVNSIQFGVALPAALSGSPGGVSTGDLQGIASSISGVPASYAEAVTKSDANTNAAKFREGCEELVVFSKAMRAAVRTATIDGKPLKFSGVLSAPMTGTTGGTADGALTAIASSVAGTPATDNDCADRGEVGSIMQQVRNALMDIQADLVNFQNAFGL